MANMIEVIIIILLVVIGFELGAMYEKFRCNDEIEKAWDVCESTCEKVCCDEK